MALFGLKFKCFQLHAQRRSSERALLICQIKIRLERCFHAVPPCHLHTHAQLQTRLPTSPLTLDLNAPTRHLLAWVKFALACLIAPKTVIKLLLNKTCPNCHYSTVRLPAGIATFSIIGNNEQNLNLNNRNINHHNNCNDLLVNFLFFVIFFSIIFCYSLLVFSILFSFVLPLFHYNEIIILFPTTLNSPTSPGSDRNCIPHPHTIDPSRQRLIETLAHQRNGYLSHRLLFIPFQPHELTLRTTKRQLTKPHHTERGITSADSLLIEADVSLLENSKYPIPIMAHPPHNTSDLSLDSFLQQIIASKSNKGIKLDFKSTKVVEPAFRCLAKHYANLQNRPLILNADIVAGDYPTPNQPVDAWTFLMLSSTRFPKVSRLMIAPIRVL